MFKKKGIEIQLDRKRRLHLGLEGMVTFEVHTGLPVFLPSTLEKMGPEEVVVLLWACLMHEGLSLPEVRRIYNKLNSEQVAELSEKLPLAWRDSQNRS